MHRKRRSPAPAFRQPSPYNPITGEFAPIGVPHRSSRVSIFQVIERDVYDDYLVCRGYDPDSGKLLESVNVAKPYQERSTYVRKVGEIVHAIKPLAHINPTQKDGLGTTAGVSEDSTAHPADLDEEIDILNDEDGNPIWWLALTDMPLIQFKLTEILRPCGQAEAEFADPPAGAPDIVIRDTIRILDAAAAIGDCGWAQVTCAETMAGLRIYDLISMGGKECAEGSSSSSSTSSSSGASKSSAIVPASWSPSQFTALFVDESPEVRFHDVMDFTVPLRDCAIPIDTRFVEVCEAGSIVAESVVPSIPILIGAEVRDGQIMLRFPETKHDLLVRIVAKLSGVRRGFAGLRFPDRTPEEFEANEAFLQLARPK